MASVSPVDWIERYGLAVAVMAVAWMLFAQPRLERAGYGALGWLVAAALVVVVVVDLVVTVREWE